jgi:hypothetical protein
MNKKKLILITKKFKIYSFLKLIENFFNTILYFSALILSKIFYNYLVKRIPKELDYKFKNLIIGPKNFYERIICNVLVRKFDRSDENYSYKFESDSYKFWRGEDGLAWYNKTDNTDYKSTFKEQSVHMIKKINELIVLKKIKNLCLIDISTGNGNFLNFLVNQINFDVSAIGFDINEEIISKNIKNTDLKQIKFKYGLISDHEDYIINLSKKYTLCFVSRKSLTNYNNNDFHDLLFSLNKIKSLSYFFIIETNNFNYNKKKETEYRDQLQFFGHNYPLIFQKYNWKIIWYKKKYINIFINDHWIHYILSKKTD